MVKYNPTPYSLTVKGIESIVEILEKENIADILEFGSGRSTDYLVGLGYNVFSFDDDAKYASKSKNVQIVELAALDDKDYQDVVEGKIDFFDLVVTPTSQRSSRQSNCFYILDNKSIKQKFSFIIIDGPNGNGRSLAFNVIRNKIKTPCYVFIDDFFHYPFVENFKHTFPDSTEVIKVVENKIKGFVIYKINSI